MSTSVARRNMIILYIVAAASFLALAYCGYYYVNLVAAKPVKLSQGFSTDMAYYDLPRMSLAVSGTTHLRIDISLEVAKRDLPIVQGYQPRMTDLLNHYLIGINPDDMRRVSATNILRHDMLYQVNNVGMPVPVHDLLLRQLVIM